MSITDQALMNQIQYSMIEPPDLGQTWASGMWALAEVTRYINQCQDQFLKDTHVQIGLANISASQSVEAYALPDDWMATVRVVWIALDGSTKELIRSDAWEADHGIANWDTVEGTPKIYFEATPRTLYVAPTPSAAGTIQVYYIPTTAQVDGTGEILTIPDEFMPGIKYGVMGQMLGKTGRAHDPRADYCMQRYALGEEIAKMLVGGWKK